MQIEVSGVETCAQCSKGPQYPNSIEPVPVERMFACCQRRNKHCIHVDGTVLAVPAVSSIPNAEYCSHVISTICRHPFRDPATDVLRNIYSFHALMPRAGIGLIKPLPVGFRPTSVLLPYCSITSVSCGQMDSIQSVTERLAARDAAPQTFPDLDSIYI